MRYRRSIWVKLIFSAFAFYYFFCSIGFVLAAGPTEPVGPTEAVGPQTEQVTTPVVGPTEQTGPTEVVGPTESPGPSPQEPSPTPSTESPQVTVENQTGSTGEGKNLVTGTSSVNNNAPTSAANIQFTNNNNAVINNNVNADLTTGGNTIGNNTVVGNVNTGQIDGAITIVNAANADLGAGSTLGVQNINGVGVGELTLSGSDQRISLANDLTGANSDNQNLVDAGGNVIAILDTNNANVNNGIDILADTGSNTISTNSVVGDITTGNIDLGVSLINLLNLINPNLILTVDVWNILGGLNGNIVAADLANRYTGPDSVNQNALDYGLSSRLIRVLNEANLNNYFNLRANTGGNYLGSNTVAGNLTTGQTRVRGQVSNLANLGDIPVFYLFNVYGKWDGSYEGIDPSKVIVNEINEQTGPNSVNENSVQSGGTLSSSTENRATADNRINIDANTGLNRVFNNSLVNSLKTGAINLSAGVVNVVNALSHLAGQFSLKIVNIFGNWTGNLSSKPKEQAAITENTTEAAANSTAFTITSESPKTVTHQKTSYWKTVYQKVYYKKSVNEKTVLTDQNGTSSESNQSQVAGITTKSSGGSSGTTQNNSIFKNLKSSRNIFWLSLIFLITISAIWILEKILNPKKEEAFERSK